MGFVLSAKKEEPSLNRPATVFNWTHRSRSDQLAEQEKKAREEREAALKKEREEAAKRAEKQMTELERSLHFKNKLKGDKEANSVSAGSSVSRWMFMFASF